MLGRPAVLEDPGMGALDPEEKVRKRTFRYLGMGDVENRELEVGKS